MYKLLIVDDERHIVNWLYELFIEKSTLELDIFKAYSGRAALAILDKVKIDIILTDIRMPGMSGLELMEKVYENWIDSKVIFLTGFNEFDYVYKAIKYNGVSYILKTEDDDEIIKAVEKAAESIEKELKNDEIASRALESEQLVKYLVQRDILNDIIDGEIAQSNLDINKLKQPEIPLDLKQPVILLTGRINSNSNGMGYGLEQSKNILSLKYLTEKYFAKNISYGIMDRDKFNILWLMQPLKVAQDAKMEENKVVWDKSAVFIREMLETFQKACKEALNLDICFLLYENPVSWYAVGRKLDVIKSIASRINFSSDTSVIFTITDDEEACIDLKNEKESLASYLKVKKAGLLQSYLEQGERKEFFNLLSDIAGGIKNVSSRHYFPAIEVYYSLALMFMSYINRCCLVEKLSFKIGLNRLTRIDEFTSWGEAVDYLFELGRAIFDLQKNEQQNRDNEVIEHIKEFVINNICGELSLVRISKSVNYNPSYISRVFKQVNGVNLFDYINNIRVEKAMGMLEKTKDNVQSVAKAVGFDSSQYFATFFKKKTGMTPQEYRNSYLKTSQWSEQK